MSSGLVSYKYSDGIKTVGIIQGWYWASKGRGLLDRLKVKNTKFKGSILILRGSVEKMQFGS